MTSPASTSAASAAATALLGELIARGVRDVVLSPGSRSQALALAAAAYERAGRVRLHVRIDERSAGFLALGLAVETDAPVAVITTSGTAVAELHPAVLEASHAGVPLILLTADRPAELQGIGANQTTRQPGIFGDRVPVIDVEAPAEGADHEAAAAELAARVLGNAGPVHVNLAFREPLSGPADLRPPSETQETLPRTAQVSGRVANPDAESPEFPAPVPAAGPAAGPVAVVEPAAVAEPLEPGAHTVVIAGTGAGEIAEATARGLGAPLLAEVASGARFGPHLVAAYRELLRAEGLGDRIERAVVFGHPTLSREVPALLEREGVEVIVVRSRGVERYDPGRRARHVDAVTVAEEAPVPEANRSWVGEWVTASRRLLEQPEPMGAGPDTEHFAERATWAREQLAELREPVTRRLLVEAVWNATWPHDRLVLGASRLIRELDRVAPGKRIPVHANRGLAGIDGTIATATGIALASQAEGAGRGAKGVTRVLLGDLALLHDAGSLLAGEGEPRPRMQVIVGNDHGGTIFDALEVAGTADAELFDRVMLTPQTVDLAALASAYGWEYRRVETRGELDGSLTPTPGRVLIEVPLARRP
ncbi:MAG: 2-succinyl-5-enolpyruvyl-6-hydroxy-3-cyclohexene-1-carboxylic-acid synthase [Microbacteriaceae bacterium]|nr:2-succinyl-5-enolpyruvyl-6-hydroxy-3-cyclohexene-1-carboxylic-acid synthase [Microbacteriaceae bacterium]